MPPSTPPAEPEINEPLEIALRILCLLGFAAGVGALPLLLTGIFYHQPLLLFYSLSCFGFVAVLLGWLKFTGRLRRLADAFEPDLDERSEESGTLDELERRLDVLEESRGAADFDPWSALDLRRKIEKRRRAVMRRPPD